MKYITAFFMAWGNFCILPCPRKPWDSNLKNLMLAFFPVIGLLVGLLWYGLWLLFDFIGLPPPLAAALLTAYPFFISGFIHLDGFLDCSDAILSRRPMEEKQRILKDSQVGAFSVISAILFFLLFFGAVSSLFSQSEAGGGGMATLILIPIISRSLSAGAVLSYAPLEHSQYKEGFDKKTNGKCRVAVGLISLAVVIVAVGMTVIAAAEAKVSLAAQILPVAGVFAAFAGQLLACAYARRQLGGMSGDVAGYALSISELTAVMALAIIGGSTWF